MPLTVPTILTWVRIALIPAFVGIYYLPETWLSPAQKNWAGALIFSAGAITDWADGYLARRLGQTSAFGAFLDPVADKLMVAAALILLVSMERADPVPAFIVVGREIAISALREWMAEIGQRRSVAVSTLGKFKTAAQLTAIIALLLYEPVIPGVSTPLVGTVALWIAVGLTLWSMIYYLRLAAPYLRGARPTSLASDTKRGAEELGPSARSAGE
ncbi:MAG: CDP-diacylglycerol--glycerol-3-phosphate 3-phosphatidyltransferase [Casimicrobiaceae bacterium]|nr:CDP-diacylglycerol--glycerol-3-phosphate 3-phosphatidyltransferase [Casimicrobiaceae bacterium]